MFGRLIVTGGARAFCPRSSLFIRSGSGEPELQNGLIRDLASPNRPSIRRSRSPDLDLAFGRGRTIDPFGIWRSRTTEMAWDWTIPNDGNGAESGEPELRKWRGRTIHPRGHRARARTAPPIRRSRSPDLDPFGIRRARTTERVGNRATRSGSGDPELQKGRGIGQSRNTEMARANHSPARASGASPNRTPHP